MSDLLVLGYADAPRMYGRPVKIAEADRFSHLYVIGRTGTGKSNLLRLLALQDLLAGRGFAVLDPHGDLVEAIKASDGAGRARVLNAAAADFRFNPLSAPPGTPEALTVASLLSVFEKLWEDNWGPRLEHLLRNVLFTLVSNPGATLGVIPRVLADKDYRAPLVSRVRDRGVREFWSDEYARYSPGFRSVVVAPLQNKIGALLTDPRLRTILDTAEPTLDLHGVLKGGHALLVNLAKGQMGEGPSSLLGALITAHLTLCGLARSSEPEAERQPFFLYLDEFPSFSTPFLATALSELRKYRVGLTLAHQYFSQLDPFVRDAALGNAGTLVSFRVGATDAPVLAREFAPAFDVADLLSLPNYHVYTRIMIAGQVSRPFSFSTYRDLADFGVHPEPKRGYGQ